MPVSVTRNRKGIWYAGGSVRCGEAVARVAEFSTGTTEKRVAEDIAQRKNAQVFRDLLEGDQGRAKRRTIAEALLSYVQRPSGVKDYDKARVHDFNEFMGHRPIIEAPAAWQDWLRSHSHLMPATIARSRSTLQAALNHGAAALDIPAPRLPGVRGAGGVERVVYLTDDERARLLAAYNPHAACPVLVLAYQGMRTQEALRMDWRHVSFGRQEIVIPAAATKTKKGRTVPMHPRVEEMLARLWDAAGKPDSGTVFLSVRGQPYADTRGRDGGRQGGNPLTQAHETACKRAGIKGFRVHDWRHLWATQCVLSGMDLRTLQLLGGWSSIRMVARYATVTAEHMAEALRKIA